MDSIFVDDAVDIVLDVGCDVSDATVRKIKYRKPNGETGVWDAALDTDPTKIKCSNIIFDKAGQWEIQAYVESSTLKSHGKIVRVLVKTHI